MNGCETKDELDRCTLWDLLFNNGPMSSTRLRMVASDNNLTYSAPRIKSLINHDWFEINGSIVAIA